MSEAAHALISSPSATFYTVAQVSVGTHHVLSKGTTVSPCVTSEFFTLPGIIQEAISDKGGTQMLDSVLVMSMVLECLITLVVAPLVVQVVEFSLRALVILSINKRIVHI